MGTDIEGTESKFRREKVDTPEKRDMETIL